MRRVLGTVVLVVALVAPAAGFAQEAHAPGEVAPDVPARADDTDQPLAGLLVVIDPGHQLGNANFPK
ncbi:MAG: hypothetical protein ACO1ON_12395, partial [Nocardioides sp.]